MTERLEVSVVIPTHNRWRLLSSAALPSALAQEEVAHEVIVVDDGSTDGTPTHLAAMDDLRLRVVRHPRRLGVAVARNTGVRAARGEWVAFLDDDDAWAPHKLRHQLDMAQTTGAAFVYCDVLHIDDGGTVISELSSPTPQQLVGELLARYAIPGGGSNVVARTSLIRELGGFDERLSITDDWDMWLRLATAAPGARCAAPLAAILAHRENMPSRSSWRAMIRDLDHFHRKHEGAGLSQDRAGFARYLALQRRRAGRRADPAFALFLLSLRFGKPLRAMRALGLLIRDVDREPQPGYPASEPDWLTPYLLRRARAD
jgi:glycosyltransferase involved in cell wall biosynthesis